MYFSVKSTSSNKRSSLYILQVLLRLLHLHSRTVTATDVHLTRGHCKIKTYNINICLGIIYNMHFWRTCTVSGLKPKYKNHTLSEVHFAFIFILNCVIINISFNYT